MWTASSADKVIGQSSVTILSDEWEWRSLPFTAPSDSFPFSTELTNPQGDVYLDMMFLTAGKQISPKPGDEITIPAMALYRAGYSDPATGAVIFRKAKDADLEILYGFFPLLEKGLYQVELSIESKEPYPPGSLIYQAHSQKPLIVPIKEARDFVHVYRHNDNVPVKIGFIFSRNADLKIRTVKIKRLE